jgi:transcriptional regulator with XRE-family HTH domain
MFTSHLDTADRKQGTTKLLSKKDENGDEIIYTDGSTILGADDKSGVAVMLYMMAHNVPGLYYFFMGEERGGIGSGLLSSVYEKVEYVKNIKRCVSFDRRDVCSVITSQLGRTCCSDEFGTALAKQYNANGLNLSLDPTGIYTDSASFLEQIAECTNISVGYYSEHTGKERQNINFLERLAKASVQVDWDSLPTVRKVGIDEEIVRKYGNLINDIKATPFGIDVKIASDRATTFIQCDLEEGYIDETYEALTTLQFLLNKHKVSQKVYFDAEYIKIDLL